MKNTINTYFAVLLITIAGSGATLLIVHVALANSFEVTMAGNGADYSSLR